MAKTPLSLADRIRAKRKNNRSDSEINYENELVKTATLNKKNKSSDQSTDQVVKWSSDQSTDQVVKWSSDQSTDQVVNQSSGQVANRSSDRMNIKSFQKIVPKKPENLTEHQYNVLRYIYFNRPFKVHGNNGVGAVLGIGAPNTRNQLSSLAKKGFIYKPYSINNGVNVGSTCRVVEEKCLPLFGPTEIINPPQEKPILLSKIKTFTTNQVVNQSSGQPINQVVNSYSSSSFLLNKKNYYCEIQAILTNHPEFGYWRQKGLKEKQIAQWIQIVQCNLETMVQYLCYCRFEMVDLDVEKSKPVDNVMNWFFRILERTGGYPKPKSYKSFQEKQLEQERQIIEQKKKEAQEAKEFYRKKIEAEQDKKFWDMMNTPKSDLYEKCFDRLNGIQKRRNSGKGFELSMRSAFDKLMDSEDEIAESNLHSLHQKKGAAKKKR